MKTIRKIYYSLFILGTLTSCLKKETPCFTYTQVDTLTIVFDASCSKNAYTYNWSFDYEPISTTAPQITYKFKTSGEHRVVLDILNKRGRRNRFSMEVPSQKETIVVY